MTDETLQRAKQLEKEIEELKKHCEYIRTEKENPYEGSKAEIYIETINEDRHRRLEKDFLPIALPEFVEMYLAKVEKHIKKLEKELEKL
jgi:ribosome recycling factor